MQLLHGHSRIERTECDLGIAADDVIEMKDQHLNVADGEQRPWPVSNTERDRPDSGPGARSAQYDQRANAGRPLLGSCERKPRSRCATRATPHMPGQSRAWFGTDEQGSVLADDDRLRSVSRNFLSL